MEIMNIGKNNLGNCNLPNLPNFFTAKVFTAWYMNYIHDMYTNHIKLTQKERELVVYHFVQYLSEDM